MHNIFLAIYTYIMVMQELVFELSYPNYHDIYSRVVLRLVRVLAIVLASTLVL